MMNDSSQAVKAHYNQSDLEQKIKAAFGKTGKKIEDLTRADIAALDEFHIRGREATRELAGLAGFRQGTSVLDLGCGVGGPARTLAAEFGCRVTGIDLIEEYCKAAEMLTEKVGLSEEVAFQAGDITDLSFDNDCFDAAWTQHITMNIEDKPRLFAEIRRVLKPGGSYALYEVCAGTTGSPHLPVPWAGSEAINFLVPPADLLGFLQSAGFRQQVWQDVSNASLEWFEKMKTRRANMPAGAPLPPGIGLLLGEDAGIKSRNLARNLAENRIRVIQAVMRI